MFFVLLLAHIAIKLKKKKKYVLFHIKFLVFKNFKYEFLISLGFLNVSQSVYSVFLFIGFADID